MTKRISIFGTRVNITNKEEAPALIKSLIGSRSGYVCFPDAFVTVSATKDKKLQGILNDSLVTFPDGQPMALYGRRHGHKTMTAVSGYWLCKALLQDAKVSHYFYGSSEENLQKIKAKLEAEFPQAHILGYQSPPFVDLPEVENNEAILADINMINALQPDIIWIGMNSPKQDYLMAYYSAHLDHSIMIGVGGVFDYLSGVLKISPEWVKKLSLRWVYRVFQNPKRYFKRSMVAIFSFLKCYVLESFFRKKY